MRKYLLAAFLGVATIAPAFAWDPQYAHFACWPTAPGEVPVWVHMALSSHAETTTPLLDFQYTGHLAAPADAGIFGLLATGAHANMWEVLIQPPGGPVIGVPTPKNCQPQEGFILNNSPTG